MPNYTPEDEANYSHLARNAARRKDQGGTDSLIAKLDAFERRKATAREAEASTQKAEITARLKNMTGAEIAAIMSPEQRRLVAAAVGVTGKAPAKPAAAASTPKASTPKRDPEAEYQRGVAAGRAAERTRISRVYDKAKVAGGDAAALRMLATTNLDSTAILAKLYGTDGSNSALGISGDVWGKAIANVYGSLKGKGGAA